MPHNRYFVPEFRPGDHNITIQNDEFHHLARVMRKREGDVVEVINGQGALAECVITHIDKNAAHARVTKLIQREKKPDSVTLALSFLRKEHLEYAVEKTTELGVDTFLLFPAEKSEKKELAPHALERLRGILIAATKQSGRLFLPDLIIKKSLEEALPTQGLAFFCDIAGPRLPSEPLLQPITLFIGPESGFTENEKSKLKTICQPLSLHTNILRAETAAIVASALATTERLG